MGTHTMEVSFNTDSKGFISQACPACDGHFKVHPDSPNKVAHCPFCEHVDEHWFTPAQAEYMQAVAASEVLGPHLDALDRQLRSLGSGSEGMIRVTGRVEKPRVPPKPEESDDDMPSETKFACCGEIIRYKAAETPLYCIVCGEAAAR
jgi:hypothetical protein